MPPPTAKKLGEISGPLISSLDSLYNNLVQTNNSSDIFPEDDSIITLSEFLELLKNKITITHELPKHYNVFIANFISNKFLSNLILTNSPSNIAIIKELNSTFQFYEEDSSNLEGNLTQYKKYLAKWLKELGATTNDFTSAPQSQAKLTKEIVDLEKNMSQLVRERIGGILCYSFFKTKRASQLKEERHDLLKRIFFELGLFTVGPDVKKPTLFAKMVKASQNAWKAAVTVYSTKVYSTYYSDQGATFEAPTLAPDGYIDDNADVRFKSYKFKTILHVFNEAGYTRYATKRRANYVITLVDVTNMRDYARSNSLDLFYTNDEDVYRRIATLFTDTDYTSGALPPDIPILAPWLSVNGISGYIRENSSNDGMGIFASIFQDWRKTTTGTSMEVDTGESFPRSIEDCCDKNHLVPPEKLDTVLAPSKSAVKSPGKSPSKLPGQSSAKSPSKLPGQSSAKSPSNQRMLCWICGCLIVDDRACDHIHAMLAMSILINITTPHAPAAICKNFGYVHPKCNGIKSQYAVSIIYGLLGTGIFRTTQGQENCIDVAIFRKLYFESLSAFEPKSIKERVDFYMKSLLVKLTVIIFNKTIVKDLYIAGDTTIIEEDVAEFKRSITNVASMIDKTLTADVTDICYAIKASSTDADIIAGAQKVQSTLVNLEKWKTAFTRPGGGYTSDELIEIFQGQGKRKWESIPGLPGPLQKSQSEPVTNLDARSLGQAHWTASGRLKKARNAEGGIRKLKVNKQRTRKNKEKAIRAKKRYAVSRKKRNLAYKRLYPLRVSKKLLHLKRLKI